MSKISEHRNVIAIPSEAVLRDRLVKIQFDSMRQLLLSSLVLDKKRAHGQCQRFRRHGVRSAAVQKLSLAGAGSHGSLLRVGPENPSSWWTVHPGRIGKSGNFPKPSLGNLANFRELKPWLLQGFS
jgi:hypothetical protein